MNTLTLSVKECLTFGWQTFKSRPWIFVGAFLIVAVANGIVNVVAGGIEGTADVIGGMGLVLLYIVSIVGSTILTTYIGMGTTNFILRAHDETTSVRTNDLIRVHPFITYLAAELLTGIAVLIGLILLIVPGIILAIALSFAPYLVIDKRLGAIAALKESIRLTRGNRWKLFLLMLAICGLNIVGALALLVGLFVSVPVSMLAIAHAYRTLDRAPEVAA